MSQPIAERVAENAPAMLVYLDADLRVRFANRHCYELLGHAPREILGRLLAEIVDPGTLKYALAHIADIARGNHAPRDYVLRHKDGAPCFVQVQAVPDRDENGRPVGYFACSADNSSARAAREALDGAEERLTLALELAQAGMWHWDLSNCSVRYTPEFASLLGYSEGLPENFAFFAALHPDDVDATHEAVAEAIQVGGGFDREFRMRGADGEFRWLRASGRATRDDATGAVTRLAGTVTNISARKEAQGQLREANRLVQASLEGCLDLAEEAGARRRLEGVRRELLASANHELRTPLAAIIAALELLRDGKCPPHERNAQAFLGLALQNAERLARVVEEWLDVERADLGATNVVRERVDVDAVVTSVADEYIAASGSGSVLIEVALSGGSAYVCGDAARLKQALAHIVSGAVERAPHDTSVSLQVGTRGDKITVLVEDCSEAPLPRNDLGFSVARAIVARLGGTLCIAKRADVGAAFHVELPRFIEG